MKSSHRWEPFRSQSVYTLPSNSVTLAPSPQRPEPETSYLIRSCTSVWNPPGYPISLSGFSKLNHLSRP